MELKLNELVAAMEGRAPAHRRREPRCLETSIAFINVCDHGC
jgi:hypothetical protein